MLCAASVSASSRSAATIHADRWLEIDLYWFDRDDLAASADRFWQRNAALFEGVSGRRGVILNVGWVMDYILDWRGSMTDRVLIAKLA